MNEPEDKLSALNELLHEKFVQIIEYRKDTWNWLREDHKLSDTEARLEEAKQISVELSQYIGALLDHEGTQPADKQRVDQLFERYKIINSYERDIHSALTNDRDEKAQEKKDKKVDLIKNITFLLGVPGVFVTGVKNGVGNGHIDQNEALLIGFAISIPTIFHKSIRSAFSKAAKTACLVPSVIRTIPAAVGNDMRVVYVREVIKDAKNKAQVCFATAAKSINDNVLVGRPKSAIRRVLGKRNPKP